MTITYADIPKPISAGLIVLDPLRGTPLRVIPMQFNPDSLQRSLAPLATQADGQGDRSEALRLIGPAVQTWKVEVELDSTDRFDVPAPDGIRPQLALLELLVEPSSFRLIANQAALAAGTLEIAPVESPLTVFVWGAARVVPVRLTELTVTEEAFDVNLNPIRATVSLGMRVLTVNDLPTGHRGAQLFLAHLMGKERTAARAAQSRLAGLGLSGL